MKPHTSRDLSSPLGQPGQWTFQSKSTGSKYDATEQTWFKARAEAARVLGVSPEDLTLIKSPI